MEPAYPSEAPVSPKPRRNTLLALVASLLLAAGLVPLLDRLDRRIREPAQLEPIVGAPLLATVPEASFPGHVPGNAVREAFQTLRASLTYFNIDRTLKSVMVTSPARGDGKTTVATYLALALAQDERNVILIDADMRKRQVATRLGVDDSVAFGLESVLIGDASAEDAMVEVDAGGGKLRVIPCINPPPNPAVLLGSHKMRTLLSELSDDADIVVLDTPPRTGRE